MKRVTMWMLLVAVLALLAGAVVAGPTDKNPFASDTAAIREGEKVFDAHCVECHLDGTGGSGPNIIDDTWTYGGSDAEVFATIANGRPGGMPAWLGDLNEEQIWKVIAYIRSLRK